MGKKSDKQDSVTESLTLSSLTAQVNGSRQRAQELRLLALSEAPLLPCLRKLHEVESVPLSSPRLPWMLSAAADVLNPTCGALWDQLHETPTGWKCCSSGDMLFKALGPLSTHTGTEAQLISVTNYSGSSKLVFVKWKSSLLSCFSISFI